MEQFYSYTNIIECSICEIEKSEDMNVVKSLIDGTTYFVCKECTAPDACEHIGNIKPKQ